MTHLPDVPPRSAIRGILFDFGNVICAFDHGRFLAALAPLCGQSPEALARRIVDSDLPRAYESGEISSQAFLAGVSERCGFDFPEAPFVRAFTDIFTPIPSTFELIGRLKPRYRLGLVSNTNPWHAEHGIRTTSVYPLFDAVALSHEVRAMKPDPRIFATALERIGLPPEACVFIDDISAFADAASKLGIHGLTYTGPQALRDDLARLGVAG